MEKVCMYDCFDCKVRATLEEKQLCSSFMAIKFAKQLMDEITMLKSQKINSSREISHIDTVSFDFERVEDEIEEDEEN